MCLCTALWGFHSDLPPGSFSPCQSPWVCQWCCGSPGQAQNKGTSTHNWKQHLLIAWPVVCRDNILDSSEDPQVAWTAPSPHTPICSWADSCTVPSRHLCLAALLQSAANIREKQLNDMRHNLTNPPLLLVFIKMNVKSVSSSPCPFCFFCNLEMSNSFYRYADHPSYASTWRSLCPADVPGASVSSSCSQQSHLNYLTVTFNQTTAMTITFSHNGITDSQRRSPRSQEWKRLQLK